MIAKFPLSARICPKNYSCSSRCLHYYGQNVAKILGQDDVRLSIHHELNVANLFCSFWPKILHSIIKEKKETGNKLRGNLLKIGANIKKIKRTKRLKNTRSKANRMKMNSSENNRKHGNISIN